MKLFYPFMLMSLFLSLSLHSLEIKEDAYYIYTTRDFDEMVGERQRSLVHYFNIFLKDKLSDTKIPTHWTADIEKTFLGDQTRFLDIIDDVRKRAKSCAFEQSIRPEDLIPTGFFLGFGISGSGDFVVGMGGSLLITLIVVPIEVEEFNKLTGETKTYYEASWAIGGIGQGGVGVGGGGKVALHGAVGLIWGDMPNASALTGPAIGLSVSFGHIQGLGVKAAFALNTTTRHFNLIAMATYDVGAQAGTEVQGAAFYFMNLQEVLKIISNQVNFTGIGKQLIDAAALTSIEPKM